MPVERSCRAFVDSRQTPRREESEGLYDGRKLYGSLARDVNFKAVKKLSLFRDDGVDSNDNSGLAVSPCNNSDAAGVALPSIAF